ncbi:M16 family metallopeptidase [Hyphococcus luteus]|uniref:M16 family metallopeptidase n=1 Tax=Hyphococcus luteus TaxID=2058213 RepID=UPI001A9C6667|nr:pitrilysin family protein [Marinicaulis flavus]
MGEIVVGIIGALVVAQPATASDAVRLIEKVTKKSDEIVIPYEKYELANGLTVILHEDKSDPIVHVDVTYHVGSAREEVGKSGFAHLFEHMMFQGSENVGDDQHFRIVSEAGGTLNGTTNSDRTNYYQTVPANQLEKMLWLESDRMGFLLPAVTQEQFEVQRATVKNERKLRVDNVPYGLTPERIAEALFPEGHPYSWQTIGYVEDLDRVNVNDLKEFFLRWYGPNNATLTIGGDFDREQTLAWVQKYFGSIPRGPEVEAPEKQPITLNEDRYISFEDNVSLPQLTMVFPGSYARHSDEAPLDILASIIGQHQTSLLYKNLVKTGLAVRANAFQYCQELACQFVIVAKPNVQDGVTLSDLETIIRDTFSEFEARGVQDDDLARAKAGLIAPMVYELESVNGKVSQLAANETFTGNPNQIGTDIERLENVTKNDVMRVYRKYIKNKPAVIASVVENGKPEQVAHADNWSRYKRKLPKYATVDKSKLKYRTPVDEFDRSIEPAAEPAFFAPVPKLWTGRTKNKIAVLGAVNNETPTTVLMFRIKAGQRAEPADKLGLAMLTAAMLNEATTQSTAEELSNRLQKLGSFMAITSGAMETTLTLKSLTKNLDETIEIAAEKLLFPKFDDADFERVKAQQLERIRDEKKHAGRTASRTFRRLLLGEKNSVSNMDIGTEETLANITLDDVVEFHSTYYKPNAAEIVVVSDLNKRALLKNMTHFAEWRGEAPDAPPLMPFPEIEGRTLYFIDRPNAEQSQIIIGKHSLPFDATGEQYRLQILNFPLGGAFNSRLNLNLREDKGYTYGISSQFHGEQEYGFFLASASVRTDATDASIREIIKEIVKYVEGGPTDHELQFAQSAMGRINALKFETPEQKLGFLSKIQTYDLSKKFVDEQKTILSSINRSELNGLAKKHLNVKDMIFVVVGDKTSIFPELERLDLEIVELDPNGDRIVAGESG